MHQFLSVVSRICAPAAGALQQEHGNLSVYVQYEWTAVVSDDRR